MLKSGLIKTKEIRDGLSNWLKTRNPGQGPSVGQVQYKTSSFECGVDIKSSASDVENKVVSALKSPTLGASDVTVVNKSGVIHNIAMITYDLSNMKSLRAIVNVDISHEQPVVIEVEGKESGNSIEIPAQILVKGFIDGFVLDQQTGTLTRPDFNTVVRIDWQIGDLISKALGGCSAEEWR